MPTRDKTFSRAIGIIAGAAAWWLAVPAGAAVIPPDFAAKASSYAAPADFDCDQKADISRRVHNGIWEIDLAANGFGTRDLVFGGYGDSTAVAVPADYDGDCRADLSVKTWAGQWFIDYAFDGYGAWNAVFSGYGDATAVPVPADYDGDGKTDLSVKGSDGGWYIDYASDGFGAWNEIHYGYGPAGSIPVPADYDGVDPDGRRRADLSVRGDDGCWYIDYARDGFGFWNDAYCGYGSSPSVPVPADYDADGRADLSVYTGGYWFIDYSANGFGGWNFVRSNYSPTFSYEPPQPVPADYDHDGRADIALHSQDEHLFIDYAADGFTGFSYADALAVPVQPKVTLVERTGHSLKVKVLASGTDTQGRARAERIRTSLVGLAGSTATVYGYSAVREFTGLAPDTRYCVTATGINSEGSTSRNACFTTEYEEASTGTATVWLNREQVISGNIPYLGSWGPLEGARPVRLWNPDSGFGTRHFIHFIRLGHSTEECFGRNHANATVTLADGGSLGPAEIALIQGVTPPPGRQVNFVACLSTNPYTDVIDTVTFNLDWSR